MNNPARIRWMALVALFVFSAAFTFAAEAPEDTVRVSGAGIAAPADWTAARLKSDLAAEAKTIEYSSRGQTHHSTCIPLLSILKASGLDVALKHDPSIDPHQKHIPLRLAVTVIGRDGYAATFALGELLPDAGNREVWLAIDTDDKPLSGADTPAKVIIPSDAKPSRWVRGVATITVVDTTAAEPAK